MMLTIIIVSYNVRELLRACLSSLPAALASPAPSSDTPPASRFTDHSSLITHHETIVIDNASTDGSADMAANDFPGVRLIRNAANLGFGRANNQGIALAQGRYILLLNSDTVLPPGALVRLLDFMETHPQAGACSPRLLLPDGRAQPYAFGSDPSLGYLLRRGVNRLIFKRALHDWTTAVSQPVDWVSGACLLLRREALAAGGRLRRSLVHVLRGCRPVPASAPGRLAGVVSPGGRDHAPGRAEHEAESGRPGRVPGKPALFLPQALQSPRTMAPDRRAGGLQRHQPLMKHFVLDARTASPHFPGIGRYVTNLARALPPLLAPDERLTLLTTPVFVPDPHPALCTRVLAVSPFALAQQWVVPRALHQLDADLYHSAYYLMPYRPGAPTVVTLYDLIPIFFPQHSTARARLLFRATTRLALAAATCILTISEATARDVCALFRIDPARVHAIPLAADPIFQPQPASAIAELRQRLALPERYVLYLGSNKPHKNLPRLIEAWARVQRSEVGGQRSVLATPIPKSKIQNPKLLIAGVWDDRYPEPKRLAESLHLSAVRAFSWPRA